MAMTKLALSYWQAPERREGRTTAAFRFLWAMLCWTLSFAAVVVATTVLMR